MSYINRFQLDIDLEVLTKHCYDVAPVIKRNWGDVEQISFLHPMYNLLCFPNKQLHRLYFNIHENFNQIKKTDELYYITMWINMHSAGQYIDWHTHNPPEDNAYHGYFAVNAEPSTTSFRMPGEEQEDIKNINNQLVIIESNGNEHSVSKWYGDYDRITIAFDIITAKQAFGNTMFQNKTNKWIPV